MSRLRKGRWLYTLLGLAATMMLAALVPGASAKVTTAGSAANSKDTYSLTVGALSNDIVTGAMPLLANNIGMSAKNGVNMSVVIGANSSLVTGLLSGSLNAILIDPEDFMTPDERGTDFVAIASIVDTAPFTMVANPKTIHTWSDLAGKTAATSQAVGFEVDSQNQMLTAAGVNPSTIHNIVVGGTSSRLAAMQKGLVDFGLLGVESTVAAQQAGLLVLGNHAPHAVHPIVNAVDLVVRRSWLQSNLPAATALVKTLLATAAWAHASANRAAFEAAEPTVENKSSSITNAAITFWFGGVNNSYIWMKTGCPHPASLQNLYALMHTAHELRPHFNVNVFWTNQVLQAAGVASCPGIDFSHMGVLAKSP